MDAIVVNALGRRIFVDTSDGRGRNLAAAGGDLNPNSLALWNTALGLRPWDVVADVGSNYGEMLVSAHVPTRSKIVAFEPNPHVLPFLKKTIAASGLSVDLREKAVGAKADAAVSFVADDEWSGTSTLGVRLGGDAAHHRLSTFEVPLSSLDLEFADESVDTTYCIKVDVEGHEHEVLEGAERLLGRAPAWALMVEVLHMSPFAVSELARKFPLYLMDTRTGGLVRCPGGNASLTKNLLHSGWLYGQDALLVSSTDMVRS